VTNFEISDFIRANGSINYRYLCQCAPKISRSDFKSIFARPLLVGSAICSGNLEQKSEISNKTMLFHVKKLTDQVHDDEDDTSLVSAIFPLHKQNRGDGRPNIITIGRSGDNDLILNDYPVSREHAQIRIKGQQFFLTDFGTTNGSSVNDKILSANTEVEIKVLDTIGFARYRFQFLSPDIFHQKLIGKMR